MNIMMVGKNESDEPIKNISGIVIRKSNGRVEVLLKEDTSKPTPKAIMEIDDGSCIVVTRDTDDYEVNAYKLKTSKSYLSGLLGSVNPDNQNTIFHIYHDRIDFSLYFSEGKEGNPGFEEFKIPYTFTGNDGKIGSSLPITISESNKI